MSNAEPLRLRQATMPGIALKLSILGVGSVPLNCWSLKLELRSNKIIPSCKTGTSTRTQTGQGLTRSEVQGPRAPEKSTRWQGSGPMLSPSDLLFKARTRESVGHRGFSRPKNPFLKSELPCGARKVSPSTSMSWCTERFEPTERFRL